jgi:hypothetical protein
MLDQLHDSLWIGQVKRIATIGIAKAIDQAGSTFCCGGRSKDMKTLLYQMAGYGLTNTTACPRHQGQLVMGARMGTHECPLRVSSKINPEFRILAHSLAETLSLPSSLLSPASIPEPALGSKAV